MNALPPALMIHKEDAAKAAKVFTQQKTQMWEDIRLWDSPVPGAEGEDKYQAEKQQVTSVSASRMPPVFTPGVVFLQIKNSC